MADVGGIDAGRLNAFVARIERLEAEIKGLNGDKSEIYKEAGGSGFDVKILREIIRLRRMDSKDLDERDFLIDLYRRALDGDTSLVRAREAAE